MVLFGAGKLGRSFIGRLFSSGRYEVVFIDVFKPIIDELNSRGDYNVINKSEKDEIINIKNTRGFDINKDKDVFLKAEEMYKSFQINGFKILNMTISNCNIN